ncbi:MAG: FAD-dependent oxidoreductase [Alphaproteobacteria bacterium]|nr:FAD-dependent oxidoreductase [Candidatus Fonsibacter sp. PEL55]
MNKLYDVIVVGGGNAALCSAISASDNGAKKILLIDKASKKDTGGNSRYTTGSIRFCYKGFSDLKKLIPNLSNKNIDFGSYSTSAYLADMERVTNGKTDPVLSKLLVNNSFETVLWMKKKGLKFTPIYSRQSYKVNGKIKFWGGLTAEVDGEGPALINSLTKIAKKQKIEIRYGCAAKKIIYENNLVKGVEVLENNKINNIYSKSLILACGGFEANPEMRTRYLGPGWEMAKVRGTKHNTGDGLKMAMDIGAVPYGNWSGCHAVFHDMNGPEFSDLKISNRYRKISYAFGIIINANGERFVDEGEDFRNYTYAKFGKEVIKQPQQFAWQIFDKKVKKLLYKEYQAPNVTFNPTIKDAKNTEGLSIPKSNWANKIDTPPFEAYGVTCGITFTFGGLRINSKAQVLDNTMKPIPGLFAAGETVGGIFYFNYPGGSGLMSGAVFGKIAGKNAVKTN